MVARYQLYYQLCQHCQQSQYTTHTSMEVVICSFGLLSFLLELAEVKVYYTIHHFACLINVNIGESTASTIYIFNSAVFSFYSLQMVAQML